MIPVCTPKNKRWSSNNKTIHFSNTINIIVFNGLIFQMHAGQSGNSSQKEQPSVVLTSENCFFFCKNDPWSQHPFIKRLLSSHWSETLCCQWESLTTFPLHQQRSHKPQKEKWSQYSLHTETWISHNAPVRSWEQSVWCWSLIRRDRREVLWRWTLFVPGSKHQSLPGSMQMCSDQDTNSPSLQPPLKQHRHISRHFVNSARNTPWLILYTWSFK